MSFQFIQINLDFCVFTLEVFKNNTQVRNLHKTNGFKEVSEKIINDKEVICMELNNENR